jgi:hypothetical protein
VRLVADYPAESVVIRRADYLAARAAGVDADETVAWLASRGRRTIYTPDTSIAVLPRPLVQPHLAATFQHALARGRAARQTGGRSLSVATALSLAPAVVGVTGALCLPAGDGLRKAGGGLVLVYPAALVVSGVRAGFRFRSAVVALLEPPAVVASQLAYCCGFVRGLSPSFSRTSGSSLAQSNRRA